MEQEREHQQQQLIIYETPESVADEQTDNISGTLRQLCSYNQFDVHISGNPSITHFMHIFQKEIMHKHTHFSHGIHELQMDTTDNTFTIHTQFDLLHNVSITVTNLDFDALTFKFHYKETIEKRMCKQINSTAEPCAICLNVTAETQFVELTKCKHIFHKQCLKEWMTKNKSCPICRENYDDMKFFEIIDEVTMTVPIDYLKIYNATCDKIIFENGNTHTIIFNPITVLTVCQQQQRNNLIALPMFDFTKITFGNGISTILSANIQYSFVDNEERRRIAQQQHSFLQNNNILCEQTYTIENGFWVINSIKRNSEYSICIKIKKNRIIDKITITNGEKTTTVSHEAILIFCKYYQNIIYGFDDEHDILCLKCLFSTETTAEPLNDILIKIDYVEPISPSTTHKRVASLTHETIYIMNGSESKNETIISFYKHIATHHSKHTLPTIDDGMIQFDKNVHISTIFIHFTDKTDNLLKHVANRFIVTINGIKYTYTENQCKIMEFNLFKKQFDEHYVISYSLNKTMCMACGEINVENSIRIECDYKNGMKERCEFMHVIVFGWNVYLANNGGEEDDEFD